MLGPEKHPWALGRPGADVWAEIWDVIAPMLSQVVSRAEPTRSRDLLLHIDRRGYPEEAYFSFSYSPIRSRGRQGRRRVLPGDRDDRQGHRRAASADVAGSRRAVQRRRERQAVCTAAAAVLAANPHDVPFAMIYRIDEREDAALLRSTAGIAPSTAASPQRVRLDVNGDGVWSLAAVARSGRPALAVELSQQFESVPTGAWKTSPHSAMVLPVLLPGQEHPRAILVAAVSPMRALDPDYRTFFGLIASQIASGLADAEALEDRTHAGRGAGRDRSREDGVLLQRQPRIPHAAHADARPARRCCSRARVRPACFPPTPPRSVDVAHRNGLRLLKLVNTLLDFSRIEAGRIDANYEPTDLARSDRRPRERLPLGDREGRPALVVDCQPLPEPVYVDRDMWEKIVLNLLSNAFKFTFEGDITVALRVARRPGRAVACATPASAFPQPTCRACSSGSTA